MKLTNRYIHLILIGLIAVVQQVSAQQIQVHAPSHVSAGENFRIAYTVNTQDVDEFRAGKIPGGLEVIAGPYESRQSSFQMINGHTSSSSSVTFTYTLYAEKNGTYTIPPAHATIGGKKIASASAQIRVSGTAQNTGNGAPRMHNDYDDAQQQVRMAGSRISGSDLFIRVTASKHKVHEQEPILLTYKVYTLVNLTNLDYHMPELNGFHSQEVKLPLPRTAHREVVNGKAYNCFTWSQFVMYPQMTGKLKIPALTFTGMVRQRRNIDPFEAMFNGGADYVEVKRSIEAPSLTIEVAPLPKRPEGFSGGVGRFNISSQLNKKEVKAGDPITLRVVVSGIGNLKLLKQPVVNFPKDFDKYDAKITDKTKLTVNGVEGNMIYDFLVVPRNQGQYTIPPVEMTYYDVTANAYKTIKTQAFKLAVLPGDGKKGASADFSATAKDQDIRPIKTGKVKLHEIDDFFYGTWGFFVSLLVPFLAFVVLLVAFRKRALENADLVKMRGKKASKVAAKRLRMAYKLMMESRQDKFYDEVLRALWGYVGDKMNIPVEQLSRENIQEQLAACGVDEPTIGKFVEAIDECEFERYAPGDSVGNMNRTYHSAMTAIVEVEYMMKKVKR